MCDRQPEAIGAKGGSCCSQYAGADLWRRSNAGCGDGVGVSNGSRSWERRNCQSVRRRNCVVGRARCTDRSCQFAAQKTNNSPTPPPPKKKTKKKKQKAKQKLMGQPQEAIIGEGPCSAKNKTTTKTHWLVWYTLHVLVTRCPVHLALR